MKLKYILSSAVLAMGLASCSNEVQEAISDQQVPLQISASIEGTRAAGVEDREFNNGEWIGFFVGDMKEAWNARAVYDGKWIIDHSDIMLDGQERPVYAYYPYDEFGTMENYLGFRFFAGVNTLVSDGTTHVYNLKPEANLTFKHVMARVSFVVTNPEKLELNDITLSGKTIYSSALYSFTDKDKINNCYDEPVIVNNTNEKKSAEVQTIDALLIPAAAGDVKLTLNFAGDKKYTTTVSLPELKMGGYYRLPITLKEQGKENPKHEGHEYVDLGLPSGTMWATCNVGASSPEEYGNYYAWGETEPKEDYSWGTYKWCRGSFDTMTKYCTYSSYGTVDNKTVLEPEDDAATVNWGGRWRMPTESELIELEEHCSIASDKMNGIVGFKLVGLNGNWIFLPAAGGVYEKKEWVGELSFIWSSTVVSTWSYWSRYLECGGDPVFSRINSSNRNHGRSVRPVLSK